MDKAQLLVDTFGECANLNNFASQVKATNIQPITLSLIFSIALYILSRLWDSFATRAYQVYGDMGDDTDLEYPSEDDELFTSTSSLNTKITPNLLKNPVGKEFTVPEATQILTGYKEADDQRKQVRDIIVYDIPYTWDVEKILGELTLWGHTIKFKEKRKLVGYFENWEATLKALDTSQVFSIINKEA
ncbi:hypothetical protein GLOIN_2v1820645 [Rhizophagus irregularis DAOM 181602=DAOM 197198]|nr:hypothetical protein GLOIN_2v1820645 [Rhizophagus irregularis DAOM 181602=DAOM 197198]